MSCCMVLLADNGKSAVLASDDIYVHYIGGLEYAKNRKDIKKIEEISPNNTYIMYAGDIGICLEIISSAKILKSDTPSIVADKISSSFSRKSKFTLEKTVLAPLGLTWKSFTVKQKTKELTDETVTELTGKLYSAKLNLDMSIVGKNGSDIEIYHIDERGNKHDRSSLGTCMIGAGLGFVELVLAQTGYKKEMDLSSVVKIAKAAMVEASYCPYVGKLNQLIKIENKKAAAPKKKVTNTKKKNS